MERRTVETEVPEPSRHREEPGHRLFSELEKAPGEVKLFLGGDVMTGRGIDQILPYACPPRIHEQYLTSALDYVDLAERAEGPIPREADLGYVWGEALERLERFQPDLRIINLETSVTTCEDAFPKGINYRMHPGNVELFGRARVDCCTLANNHVLDWGEAGLIETLETLEEAGIRISGAGRDLETALAPAVLHVGADRRVLLFSAGALDSGIPREWAATPERPGLHVLEDFSSRTSDRFAALVERYRRPGDLTVASIHWGGNWGYSIPREHRAFAHRLIGEASVDVVYGHSSHHAKGIEIYRDRPILYGCGDLLNDYEGITGMEEFRPDLVLMYLPTFDASGRLVRLRMDPLKIRNFRLQRATDAERAWMRDMLSRECGRFGHTVGGDEDTLELEW